MAEMFRQINVHSIPNTLASVCKQIVFEASWTPRYTLGSVQYSPSPLTNLMPLGAVVALANFHATIELTYNLMRTRPHQRGHNGFPIHFWPLKMYFSSSPFWSVSCSFLVGCFFSLIAKALSFECSMWLCGGSGQTPEQQTTKKMAFADRWPNKRKSLPINFGGLHPAKSLRRPQYIRTHTHAHTLRWKLRPPDTSISFMGSNHRRRSQTMPEKNTLNLKERKFLRSSHTMGYILVYPRIERHCVGVIDYLDSSIIEWKLAFLYSSPLPFLFFFSCLACVWKNNVQKRRNGRFISSLLHFTVLVLALPYGSSSIPLCNWCHRCACEYARVL